MLLCWFFEMQNYAADVVADRETALGFMKSQSFDIIFSNFHMPDITDVEFAAEVRQMYPNLPITLITGVVHQIAAADLEQVGITKVSTKSFDLDDISKWFELLTER